jgi:S1-C subfamily serine protease
MLQDEQSYETPYTPYTPYAAQRPYSAPVGVLDAASPPQAPSPPWAPPTSPQKPRRRSLRTGAIVALTLVLIVVFGVGLFAGWQFAGHGASGSAASSTTTPSGSQSSANVPLTQQEAAIASVEPAVVELKVTTAQGEQIGSGVIIDKSGDIVTNNHVVNGAQSIVTVLNNGSSVQAQLVGTASAHDLAVVRIAPFAHMTVAQIGDSSKLTVGQSVLAIGNPLGITETATQGIVSALNRSVTESTGTTIGGAIQTDASINPGNSGGALVNLQGQLIGIPTLTAINSESNTPANGVGFAIPSNLVQATLHQIIR